MSGLAAYLESIVTPAAGDSSDGDKRVLEEWRTHRQSNRNPLERRDHNEPNHFDEAWVSVLDIYGPPDTSNRVLPDSTLARLLLKPNVEPLLDSLLAITSSSRPNEIISEEIAELIGFDDIELVMEILENRTAIIQDLTAFLVSWPNGSNPAPYNGLGGERRLDGEWRGILLQVSPDTTMLDSHASLAPEDVRRRMEKNFRDNDARPLFSGTSRPAPEVLPHVYSAAPITQGNVLSQFGSRYMLPLGTTRNDYEDFEEVIVPPTKAVPPREAERLIPVSELPPLAKGSFPGYVSLNRIQSIVYPTAFGSNENMLICAPTGAGKTDVAMLSILRVVDQHRSVTSNAIGSTHLRPTINKDLFKIIYVAPMKALASEIVRKLGKRLQWLSIQVKELTGDMQLTKNEIAETQIIVTTPEKWDVVTRKPTGEGELASKLKLLIIDEVHLLNEERGAVIETIVARTLRQVESSQSVIRIVGLSATLPNFMDVAEFLSVSRYKGLFYFDSSFRPIPFEQHFIGVRGKPGSPQSRQNLDRVVYKKVAELVAQGHQVMVFVHARKETVKTALALKDAAQAEGVLDDFICEDHPQWALFRRSIGESRNKEMKQLFDQGFGIHHAGMLRSDRNMMERMFETRAIKVLCCTATLAWGVNLPAHAVVIKGTQVYDSSKGAFVDLSILDVLQVFGRAGRPGLETSGEGYICTTEDKLTHYLDAVTSQNPIESRFTGGMVDSLNAEISLGTVANMHDAVRWLGYTYLFVRMRKNPFHYGITREALVDDPQLGNKRHELVKLAANNLAAAHMIIYDQGSSAFTITDLGRIAAKYYIRHSSIEIFNKEFRPKMTEADVLAMLSMSSEFDQVQVRESEIKELEVLMENVPCAVKGGADTSQGKVNILLQGFISRHPVDDFALVSDTAYAAQNGGRIARALLEIAVSRKWANVTAVLMGVCKAIEKRLWPFDQPLKQFDLKADIFYGLERWADDWSVAELASQTAIDLGQLVHLNGRHGSAILNAAKQFPTVQIEYDLRPLGSDVLKVQIRIHRAFVWNPKIHGTGEPFWLWVEDHEGLTIVQLSHLIFRQTSDTLNVDFVIFIPDGHPPPSLTIRFVSDRWMGAEDEVSIFLDSLIMPSPSNSHLPTLDLPFLPVSALGNPSLERHFSNRLHNFNAIQTQILWVLLHTKLHSLICAPSGCGKSLMGQILVWASIINASHDTSILVVTPRRSVSVELISDLRLVAKAGRVSVRHVMGHDVLAPCQGKSIRIVTAAHLLTAMSNWNPGTSLTGFDLVVCENMEQLDSAYELGLSLLRIATQPSPTRYVGFASSLNDPADLASWLDVDPLALHSFRPRDRDQSLAVVTQTFTIPQSASLFKAMAKPAHAAIQVASSSKSAIVFVPSRGQCPTIAQDLLTQCALEMETERGYVPPGVSQGALQQYLDRLRDTSLVDFASRGLGFFHDGIQQLDRNTILEMYAEGIIRVLIVPRDSCWTLPVRATVVLVMGTQYMNVHSEGSERQLCDYGLTELVRMQSRAVHHSGSGHFYLFCQAEAKDTFTRFLNEGLPLESQLLESHDLKNWYQAKRKDGNIVNKQQAVDALSSTFLARRIASNPTYYDATSNSYDESLSRIVDKLEQTQEM